jgi:hypothetical protein
MSFEPCLLDCPHSNAFSVCRFRTVSSGKVDRNPLLAFMPAIIDDDDSDNESEFDNMSEGLSYLGSLGSELDRVVTPFAPFHPDIPLVRTRVLEELTERMPIPYPSETVITSFHKGMQSPSQRSQHSYEPPKTATQYFTSTVSHKPHDKEGSSHFDPNVDEKMVAHGGCEFDALLGQQNDDSSNDQEWKVEDELFSAASKAQRQVTNHRKDAQKGIKGIGKRRRPKPTADALRERAYCEEIGDNDVLLGRGPQIYQHEGNQRFHELKQSIQPRYLEAPKDGKVSISQSLVDAIHDSGGRFLKYDASKGMWYVVLNKVAREKAAQALRETFTKEDRQKKRLKYKKTVPDLHEHV